MAGLAILALAGLGYGNHEHKQYVNYVQKVQDTVDKQKAAVESITKQQAIVTKGIQDEQNTDEQPTAQQPVAPGFELPTQQNQNTATDTLSHSYPYL